MSRTRILHVIPTMGGGGAERQLCYLAAALPGLEWDVHVALVHGGPNMDRLRQSGATVHRLPVSGNHDPRLILTLADVVRMARPVIIQTWLAQSDIIGGTVARASRVPWILSERCSAELYPPTVKNRLRRFLARGAAAIVANSEAGASYWGDHPVVVKRVIPNVVPIEEIDAGTSAAPAADSMPLIVAAGRFDGQKNVSTLLRAMALLLERTPARVIWAGEGPDRAPILAEVDALGLARSIALPGYVDNLWSLLKAASVFVSISHFEGNPNTLLEAMTCRCPLVVSDIPMHRETIGDAGAVFVDRFSPDAVARAVEQVLREPTNSKRRADLARARVEDRSARKAAIAYDALYTLALSGVRRPE